MRFSSLRGKKNFQLVSREGKRIGQGFLQLRILSNSLQINRLGIVIPVKTVRSAVARNRIRRLIKESFRDLSLDWVNGYDIVVVVRDEPDVDHMHFVRDRLNKLLTTFDAKQNVDR